MSKPNAWVAVVATTILIASADAAQTDRVRIAAGSYTIGSNSGPLDSRPAHTVTVASFWLDRHEVSNAQFVPFLASMRVTARRAREAGKISRSDLDGPDAALLVEDEQAPRGRPFIALDDEHARIALRAGRFVAAPGYENHPVTEVTWDGARAYCAWRGARLPTEAEWEAATRGVDGRVYPWGNSPPTAQRALFGRTSGATEPVGSFPAGATPEGLLDLAGSLAEWTSTAYRSYPYRADDGREDPGPNVERVTRGGDYVYDSEPARMTAFFRGGFSREPDRGHRHIGFRCAMDDTGG